MANNDPSRPVPQPRRVHSQTSYENVSLDAINKNIILNNDNLQTQLKPKVPNNKQFKVPTTDNAPPTDANKLPSDYRSVITELNNLNLDKTNKNVCNKNFEDLHKLNNLPVPAPRRLASISPTEDIYENNKEAQLSAQDIYESNEDATNATENTSPPLPSSPRPTVDASSGAIRKVARKAPQLPLPPPPNTSPPSSCPPSNRNTSSPTKSNSPPSNTKQHNQTVTSSGVVVDEPSDDFGSPSHRRRNSTKGQKIEKSTSSGSLNSSHSGTSSTGKYTTNSPGSLLKALGSTSRQLTESISERAAKRVNKLQQSSKDTFNDATRHLKTIHQSSLDRLQVNKLSKKIKNVRQSIGLKLMGDNPFPERHQNTSRDEYDFDRPQTVPPNDEIFQSISFNSPLTAKTSNCYDLSESSYEVPRSHNRSLPGDLEAPPAYRELYKTLEEDDEREEQFQRSTGLTQSMRSFRESTVIPCPTYPAPILNATPPPKSNQAKPEEGLYGRLKAAPPPPASASNYTEMSPVRRTNRKDYEDTQIRFKVKSPDIASNRATADSEEYFPVDAADRFPRIFSRDVPSSNYGEMEQLENSLPSPSRSESWAFYDTTQEEADTSSSPEPIYANNDPANNVPFSKVCSSSNDPVKQVLINKVSDDNVPAGDSSVVTETSAKEAEPTDVREAIYGAVYTESSTGTVLTPQAVPRKKKLAAAAKLSTDDMADDIIKEFDPLVRTTIDKICSSKSNELILLESLLGEDTYGTTQAECSAASSDHSDGEEDEEETSTPESVVEVPAPVVIPPRVGSSENKKQAEPSDERTSIIVHQNLKLHAFDLEDEEAAVSPYLAKIEKDVDVPTEGKTTKTNWFVDSNLPITPEAPSTSKLPENAPPPYSEEPPDVSTADDKRAPKFKMSSMFSKFNIRRKASFNKTPSPSSETKSKPDVKTLIEMIPRPPLTKRLTIHEGTVIRLPSKAVDDVLKEQHRAMAFVRDRRFQVYTDKDMKTAKENLSLESITTIQCVSQHKFTNNSIELHCFEITTMASKSGSVDATAISLNNPNTVLSAQKTANRKLLRTCHLYGVAKESDRFIWMQKVLESMTDVFETGHTCRFYRAGWCYMKNSITSQWSGAWILLQKHKKRLVCYTMNDMNIEVMDLRKARCLILKESDESIGNLHVESGPMLMIDCPPFSMYMIMCSARETKIWRHIIMEVAHNNGPSLKEQQLTKDDVAVLVDKCVNFVYAHGSMSEGIYRKSGSENNIQRLLQLFRADAFSVQITRSEYTEHDVANALKRFMRDLPERMLGKFSASFASVAAMKSRKDKLTAYKELLQRLPSIEYQTLRKLIGHLNFIQSQAAMNKMHVENLAIVWGPTLLEDKQRQAEMQFSQREADVIVDLVMLYKNLYQLTSDEMAKEQIMLSVLQKYHAAAENLSDSVKHSGDLKVWIVIDDNPDDQKEEKKQVNVTLTPNKTVYDVCKELAPRIKREPIAVTLNEHILDGELRRPMHHSEKVFDVVLKWSYWPEADRKNNLLRLQPIKLMKDVHRLLRTMPIVTPNKELRYADNRSKTLKLLQLELSEARISVMKKDKSNCYVALRELDLRTMTAYLGCEKKRDCQQRWSITLIENEASTAKCNLRTRESPFIGHVIAGAETNDSLVWYASILHGLYGDDILPSAEIIMT